MMLLNYCRAVLMVEAGFHAEAERILKEILEKCKPAVIGKSSGGC